MDWGSVWFFEGGWGVVRKLGNLDRITVTHVLWILLDLLFFFSFWKRHKDRISSSFPFFLPIYIGSNIQSYMRKQLSRNHHDPASQQPTELSLSTTTASTVAYQQPFLLLFLPPVSY